MLLPRSLLTFRGDNLIIHGVSYPPLFTLTIKKNAANAHAQSPYHTLLRSFCEYIFV